MFYLLLPLIINQIIVDPQHINFQTFALQTLKCDIDSYNISGCTSCPSYTYKTSILNLTACQPCSEGCISCSSPTNCTTCNQQYKLNNTQCICANEATNCNSPNISCPPNAYSNYLTNSCLLCPYIIGCKTCLSSTKCKNCSIGFYLSQNICLQCNNFCSNCSDNICIECFQGYDLDQNNNCQAQQNQNAVCSPSSYSSEGNCIPCSLGLNCQFCRDQQTCTACNQGYYLNSFNFLQKGIIMCQPCAPNCLSCVSSLDCTACLDNTTDCLLNPCEKLSSQGCTNCMLSSQGVNCLNCRFEQHLTESYQCANCPANCQFCTTKGICQGCVNGFYRYHNICIPCSSFCLSCSNAFICQQCLPTYYAYQAGCLACSQNCYLCIDGKSCQICFQDYLVDINSGSCKQQVTNTGLIIGLSVALAIMVIVMGIMIYFCVKKLSLGHGSGNQYIQVN